MKIICAYLGGLISVWLLKEARDMGFTPDSDMIYALPAALGTAIADDYEWLVDWLNRLKEKTTK